MVASAILLRNRGFHVDYLGHAHKGVGSGVFEIALRYDAEAYRTVLAVQLGKKIYVLHAFQKKSKKGIETAKHDVDLIKQRYAEAKERAKHEEK